MRFDADPVDELISTCCDARARNIISLGEERKIFVILIGWPELQSQCFVWQCTKQNEFVKLHGKSFVNREPPWKKASSIMVF